MSVPFVVDHDSDPYTRFPYGSGDSYVNYARIAALLRAYGAREPNSPVLSEQLAQAAREIEEQMRLADDGGGSSSGAHALLRLLLFLLLFFALVQSLWFLLGRLYSCRASQLYRRTKGHTPPQAAWMAPLAFLAPHAPTAPLLGSTIANGSSSSNGGGGGASTSSTSRAPVLFGIALGCTALLLTQWLLSPAVMIAMWGIHPYGSLVHSTAALTTPHDLHLARNFVVASDKGCPVCPPASTAATVTATACPVCNECPPVQQCPPAPVCPAQQPPPPCPTQATVVATLPLADSESCPRISDPPPLGQLTPLVQASYSPLPVRELRGGPCFGSNWASEGRWVVRPGFDASNPATWPSWTQLDQWGLFGAEPTPEHFQYVWEPAPGPDGQCAVGANSPHAWRRFDGDKFLHALSGRTVSFLGDSMVRQQFGFLLALLQPFVLGTNHYYPPTARQLDPVREVYLLHNVTLKNQWLMGHNDPQSLQQETYPTLWRSDAVLLNIGAFFSADREADFDFSLNTFMEWADKHYAHGSIIWREYSPTHFDTPDGEYDMGRRQDGTLPGCKSFDLATATPEGVAAHFANFRLERANGVVEKNTHGGQRIPLMRVFNASLLIPDGAKQHPGDGDCRHWFSKSSVLEHWADVLYNMIVPVEQQ